MTNTFIVCHFMVVQLFKLSTKDITCLSVFQDETGKPVRVIVKGEPASGKTTFVKKVCSEWSTLHKNSEEPVCSEIKDVLGQYDLLIPVILRLVKHGASLEDTIKNQIELDEKKMLTLKWMLKKTERTVLVFDGLDEYDINRSSDITNVMNGNTFKHVVITSRAEAVNKTQEWKQTMYKEAELKGFSDEHIELYVEKFFKTAKEPAKSLLSHIFDEGTNLLELARNPGSLCMICILHNNGTEIQHMTREQLYEEYVAFLLSRWEQRQNPEGKKTPRSQILKKYHEILLKFGELANVNEEKYMYTELSFTLDQIKSIVGEEALNYGYLYKSHPSSRLVPSHYSFVHKTMQEFFLAYFIKYTGDLDSFKQRLYKDRYLLKHELSLTRFLLHLYMSPNEAFEFTTNIIGSKPDKNLFVVLLKLYTGCQHDEYQTTLTFNDWKDIYIYQYPCYVIRADRRHQDSLSSYNKDMIRRMNTDNKHKAVTVPLLQTASTQEITCGDLSRYLYDDMIFWSENDFYVYCRTDYEVTVTGNAQNLQKLCLKDIEKVGDINMQPVNDRLEVDINSTNLHGHVMLTKPWMALVQSLTMSYCKLEAGDISVIADSMQACTSPTGAELASPCRLQKLNLQGNSLTGAGADITRIIPLCMEINLDYCELEAGDISVIADNIQACTSPTGAESASPCRLLKLNLEGNSLTGYRAADIARIIPLCMEINLVYCELEAGDISVIADSIQACTSPTGAESASLCRLQKLDLSLNSLTGAGADIARIIPLCTEINLVWCKLEAGDISVITDSIQACTSSTGAESASPCWLQKLDLSFNSLTGAGADIARIIPLCTQINLTKCKLEAGDISVIADSIQACSSPTGAESASPCRLQKLDLNGNSLTGAGADISRIIPLCTEIDLSECKLEAGDVSVIADSIQACTSPTGAESASPCRLQKLYLGGNSLTGAGADIARIISCIQLCTEIRLGGCDLNNEDFHAIVNAIIQTHSEHDHSSPDRRQTSRLTSFWNEFIKYVKSASPGPASHTNRRQTSRVKPASPAPASHTDRRETSRIKPASPGPASHTDRRQRSRIKPASPGPASHIEELYLQYNKFRDVKTVRLLLDNLPPSLRWLDLRGNQFNKEEMEEIRRTYKDKHPNLDLSI